MLSARVSAIWIGVLCAVLLFHCGHLIRMRGEGRWLHGAHVVMLIGMVYMYAAVAFGVDWLPAAAWIAVYAASSAAIASWMIERWRRRRSVGALWPLALVQQAAMVYMWLPMSDWVPWLSYALGAYFASEMVVWLAKSSVVFAPAGAAVAGPAPAHPPHSVVNDLCMTVMAASMGYMFVGMQSMMTLPTLAQPSVAEAPPGLQTGRSNESGQATPSATESKVPETYVIAAGDTLSGLALRFYGSAPDWRSIAMLNPGLDPRRMPVGRSIRLPPRVVR
jgi:hypothetical protein